MRLSLNCPERNRADGGLLLKRHSNVLGACQANPQSLILGVEPPAGSSLFRVLRVGSLIQDLAIYLDSAGGLAAQDAEDDILARPTFHADVQPFLVRSHIDQGPISLNVRWKGP